MAQQTSHWMAAACVGVVALLVSAAGAHGESLPLSERPAVSVTLQPVAHGGTATVLTQVAPARPGAPERWILNAMWSIANNSGDDLVLLRTSLRVGDYTGTCDPSCSSSSDEPGAPVVVPAGDEVLVPAAQKGGPAHGFQGEMPHPTMAASILEFEGYDEPVRVSSTLKVHRHETPSGAYHFPLRATPDLPADVYWTNGNEDQDNTAHHYGTSQAYAYDIVAKRWTGPPAPLATCPARLLLPEPERPLLDWDCEWTTLTEEGVNKEKRNHDPERDPNVPEEALALDDYLAYGKPVYAMESGTILECRDSNADPVPPDKGNGLTSNRVWIQHGEGEYALYTHLKQGSIPDELCPPESVALDDPVTVHAGQRIGEIGNTGNSSEPHLHVHLSRNAPQDIDDNGGPGLPLMFDRFETAPSADGKIPEVPATEFSFVADDTPRALPRAGLVKPYPCGWATPSPADHEATQFNVPDECVDEIFEDLVENEQDPVAIDGMTLAGATSYNLIHRSAQPTWTARFGLTRKQLQARLDALAATRFRPIYIDNYVLDGQLRFAAVWAELGGPARLTYHGVTQGKHDAKLAKFGKDGYRPLVVSATTGPGGRRYSAIYEQRDVGGLFTGVTPVSELDGKADELAANGLAPVHFDGFDVDGAAHISHTWDAAAGRRWIALADLDQATLEEKTAELFDRGWFTTSATGYDAGGGARFAAIWRPSP